MPDAHWIGDARLKGTRVVVISADYMPTANKADEVIILRAGTDTALLLGVARELIAKNLYDKKAVVERTDLPLLVRLDTGERLSARDVFPDYAQATLENYVVLKPADEIKTAPPPPPFTVGKQIVPNELRETWGDFVYWDRDTDEPKAVSRDEVGGKFRGDPACSASAT